MDTPIEINKLFIAHRYAIARLSQYTIQYTIQFGALQHIVYRQKIKDN